MLGVKHPGAVLIAWSVPRSGAYTQKRKGLQEVEDRGLGRRKGNLLVQ